MQASKNSSLMPIKVVYDGLNPRQILSYFQADNNPKIVAAAVQGKDYGNQFNMIVIGDTDLIHNNFWTSSQPLLDKTILTPIFNNADFILNSLDYLTQNNDLLNLRGKSTLNREFKGIENRMVWYKDALYCAGLEFLLDENNDWYARPYFVKLELVENK